MMKKQQFVIVLAVLALVACMALAVSQRWRFPLVNRAVGAVLLPVNGVVLFVHDKVASFGASRRLNSTLQEENAQLKSRLGHLDSAEYRIARRIAVRIRRIIVKRPLNAAWNARLLLQNKIGE